MIQLSLFPQRGYLIASLGVVLEDMYSRQPAFYRTRRAANAVASQWPDGCPIPAERHPATECSNGLPTYVVR